MRGSGRASERKTSARPQCAVHGANSTWCELASRGGGGKEGRQGERGRERERDVMRLRGCDGMEPHLPEIMDKRRWNGATTPGNPRQTSMKWSHTSPKYGTYGRLRWHRGDFFSGAGGSTRRPPTAQLHRGDGINHIQINIHIDRGRCVCVLSALGLAKNRDLL